MFGSGLALGHASANLVGDGARMPSVSEATQLSVMASGVVNGSLSLTVLFSQTLFERPVPALNLPHEEAALVGCARGSSPRCGA